jgi:hypothetical protein
MSKANDLQKAGTSMMAVGCMMPIIMVLGFALFLIIGSLFV